MLVLIKIKKNSNIKGRGMADGKIQRNKKSHKKEDATSLIVAI